MNTAQPTTEAPQPHGWRFNERQACLEPAEPVAFQPASLLIRAELAGILAHPPGAADGLKVSDLLEHAQPMADFPNDYQQAVVVDMLSILIRTLEEIDGLVR